MEFSEVIKTKVALVAILGGCASAPEPVVDQNNSAMIRVFHGAGVRMHFGTNCYGPGSHPQIWAAAGGFSMLTPNKRIGMMATDDLPWSYGEFRIPADKNVVLEMKFEASDKYVNMKCGPLGVVFVPVSSKSYDASLEFAGGYCSVRVREIIEISAGRTNAIPVATTPALKCARQ